MHTASMEAKTARNATLREDAGSQVSFCDPPVASMTHFPTGVSISLPAILELQPESEYVALEATPASAQAWIF